MRLPSRERGVVPGGGIPRFPGFDVVSQSDAWDPVTAGVVLGRLAPLPPLRFFGPRRETIVRPLVDLILDQHTEPRVPVVEMIDQRLSELTTDGWHYEDLPPDPKAWTDSMDGLDDDARHVHSRGFGECDVGQQSRLLQAILDLRDGLWHGMPADRVWSLWSRYACSAFYSHPWAWNEIGFPGPAYPRGYKNPGIDTREPFEVQDDRDRDHGRGGRS